MAWMEAHAINGEVAVLDIGGRNINGSPRHLFPNATVYRVLDIAPDDGVEIVADAATWTPDQSYDVVVACEVFEHTNVWPAIVRTAYRALVPGGAFITTMAGPGRAPHSAVDGYHVREWEHYGNVEPLDLRRELEAAGFRLCDVDEQTISHDVRAIAYR